MHTISSLSAEMISIFTSLANIYSYLSFIIKDKVAADEFDNLHMHYNPITLEETIQVYQSVILKYSRKYPEWNFWYGEPARERPEDD